MPNRITKTLVTFAFPFRLDEIDEELPAGGYTIETEDQALNGQTFIARLWIETVMIIRPKRGSNKPIRFVEIDPEGLERALVRDRAQISAATPLSQTDQDAVQNAENEGMTAG